MDNEKYGVHPIPTGERRMGYWDMFANWFGANANNGTWFIGGVIAASGFLGGFSALIIASVISYLFLGMVGYMGYNTGLSTTTLMRAPFGIRGALVPSILNLIMFMGWTAVNTFIAATSLSYIFNSLFGWPVYGKAGGLLGLIVGILVMTVLHFCSVAAGQRSVQIIERVGIVLVIFFVAWEAFAVFSKFSIVEIAKYKIPNSQSMPFGAAIDAMAAFNLAWVTGGADFTRFTNKEKVATRAPFWGAFAGAVSFATIGLCTTISIAITTGTYNPNNSDPSTVASKMGLGIVALLVIVLTSMTANAVNLQSAGSALNNMFHKISLKKSLIIVTVLSMLLTLIPIFLGSFLDAFTAFLNYIGMFLGPIIAIMLVDFFILNHRHYDLKDLTSTNGKFWYKHGINWFAMTLWILGIVLYLWLKDVPFFKNTIGATFVVMIIVGALYYVISKLGADLEKKDAD